MLTLNLSTVSGQLQSSTATIASTATIDRGTRRLCDCEMSDCNGHCADYTVSAVFGGGALCDCEMSDCNGHCADYTIALGDDKGKTDGDKDDPHNDIVARLEALYCLDGPITVKRFTPIETVADYVAWCMGVSVNPRGCTDDDPCGSALCPYCG